MKTLKLLTCLCFVFGIQNAFSQTASHLSLSNDRPAEGEKISMTYDPTGTVIDGKTDITAAVYFLDGKKFPVADVDLKPEGKNLTGSFVVPANTKAFFVRVNSGQDVDNNNEKGYVWMVYKDGKPVEGAYAMNGRVFLRSIENFYAKVKVDNAAGTLLFSDEFKLYPNGDKDYVYYYYDLIARVPDYKDVSVKKIAELERSSDEKDLNLAATMLAELKENKLADSLNAIMRSKFPNGTVAKNELGRAFFKEKDPAKKDSLYRLYISKYPEDKTEQSTIQDNFRMQLATAYLNNGDMKNFRLWDDRIKDKSQLQGELNDVAYEWAKKGEHMDDAITLSKESLEIVSEEIKEPKPQSFASPSQMKKNAEYTYDMNADTYAFILAKQNKFDEALKYEQAVIEHATNIDGDEYGNYVNILDGVGQYEKAKEYGEKAVKAGQGSEAVKNALKIAYIKIKGSDNGYDDYVASLSAESSKKTRDDLAKTMISQPAPKFTLKDLDGNSISLADLKGKIVIVDFWATWCGPCKASFPGMQMAVNKYKDDPNVKFLFVDTWETDANYATTVKKFIADNQYTFHVLLDEKNAEGRQAKVVSDYGVEGIPTKFIIDKDGNIRFKYIGYTGTPEKLVEEVADMINMADGPVAVPAAAKETAKTGTNK